MRNQERIFEADIGVQIDNRLFGTVDGTNVHPREVVRRSLVHNAAAVIFAHNHPSGAALAAALARCPEAVCRRYLPHGRR